MNSLRISGYDKQYMYQMLKGFIRKNELTEEEISSGSRKRYRSRD